MEESGGTERLGLLLEALMKDSTCRKSLQGSNGHFHFVHILSQLLQCVEKKGLRKCSSGKFDNEHNVKLCRDRLFSAQHPSASSKTNKSSVSGRGAKCVQMDFWNSMRKESGSWMENDNALDEDTRRKIADMRQLNQNQPPNTNRDRASPIPGPTPTHPPPSGGGSATFTPKHCLPHVVLQKYLRCMEAVRRQEATPVITLDMALSVASSGGGEETVVDCDKGGEDKTRDKGGGEVSADIPPTPTGPLNLHQRRKRKMSPPPAPLPFPTPPPTRDTTRPNTPSPELPCTISAPSAEKKQKEAL